MVNNTGNDQQIAKFMQAITAWAEQQRDEIRREVEAFREQRLSRAEQEVLQESFLLVQQEQDQQRRALAREIAGRETAARRTLLEKRQRITEAIFEAARQKLLAHTDSPAYPEELEASLKALSERLPAEGTVYYLRPADEPFFARLAPLCPTGSELKTAADIALGGIRGENPAAGLRADDTLDARLTEQTRWFEDQAGLTME